MRSYRLAACACIVCLAISMQAKAINIVPVFNAVDNHTPAFDLFNEGIQDLFAYAEGYYEDIFEDAGHTLTINYWYEDLGGGYLGIFNPVTTSNGRITECNIRIDTQLPNNGSFRPWYIDPFPETDSEFEMEKTVWGTFGTTDFGWNSTGDVPAGLEIGYEGQAVAGGSAAGKYDMLSTILHEFGHALGIRGGAAENNDDDYDLNPSMIFGADVSASIDTKDFQPDPGHMRPDTLLMCGECGASNVRRRPSHADLIAMATSNNYSQVDLPRREFLGGGVFNYAPNWSGARTPDANDEAFVREAGLVTMSADDVVAGLSIIDDTTLAVGTHNLNVNGACSVGSRFSSNPATIVVGSVGSLLANDVVLHHNGVLNVTGGLVSVLGDISATALEYGNDHEGTIAGNGSVTVIGRVSGPIEFRPEGGVLTIHAGSFDLDGDAGLFGYTLVNATLGNIIFDGPHVDTFKDLIDIGFGRLVTFQNAWTLDADGDVNITDGGLVNNGTWHADGNVVIDHTVAFGVVGVGGTGAMVQGSTGNITTSGVVDFLGDSTVGGTIHVTTGAARFSAGGTFTDTANVTLDAGTTMNLILDQLYEVQSDATFTGPGTLVIGEQATVVLDDNLVLGVPLQLDGTVQLGNSPGEVTAAGGFTQSSTGTAAFEIGGLSAGQDFDVLNVTGTVNLDGTLALSLINGFVPGPGESFRIIQADSVLGTFSSVTGTDLGGGLTFQVAYNTTDVTLYVVGQPIPGDLNGDGYVGLDDLSILLDNWNQTVPPGNPLADPSGDNYVGLDDLAPLLDHWNLGIPPAPIAVPEPAGFMLLSLGGLAALRRRA